MSRWQLRCHNLGALGVLNLEGIQTRYTDPNPILDKISQVEVTEFVPLMQRLYAEPIQPELIRQRIQEIKQQGGIAAVSATPAVARQYGMIAAEAGADLFVVQATVVSTTHVSPPSVAPLNLAAFCQDLPIPAMIGNCVTYDVALDLNQSWGCGCTSGHRARCSLYLSWGLRCWCSSSDSSCRLRRSP